MNKIATGIPQKTEMLACPHCGSQRDVASQLGGGNAPPQPGDICLCGSCAELSVFEAGHKRKLTPDEQRELEDDRDTMAQIRSLQLLFTQRPMP